MNEFVVYFLSHYPSRSADCCVISNILRPRIPPPARIPIDCYVVCVAARSDSSCPVVPSGGDGPALASCIIRLCWMAPAVAVLTIEAQLIMLTQRPFIDTTSVVVVVVFSGGRLAYGGGRHGFGLFLWCRRWWRLSEHY